MVCMGRRTLFAGLLGLLSYATRTYHQPNLPRFLGLGQLQELQ